MRNSNNNNAVSYSYLPKADSDGIDEDFEAYYAERQLCYSAAKGDLRLLEEFYENTSYYKLVEYNMLHLINQFTDEKQTDCELL